MSTKRSTKQAPAASLEFEVGEGVKVVDEGAYPARIAWVIDLGFQESMMSAKPKRQFLVGFEIQGATCSGEELEERPILSRRYSMSWGERAELPKLLRAVNGADPRPGETIKAATWIDAQVSVVVEHKQREGGGVSARIASVTRNNAKLPKLDADPILYPGITKRGDLPEWVQNILDEALEVAPTKAKRKPTTNEEFPADAGDLGDVPL